MVVTPHLGTPPPPMFYYVMVNPAQVAQQHIHPYQQTYQQVPVPYWGNGMPYPFQQQQQQQQMFYLPPPPLMFEQQQRFPAVVPVGGFTRPHMTCFSCRGIGHKANNCPLNPRPPRVTGPRAGEATDDLRPDSGSNLTCFACRGVGHKATQCPLNPRPVVPTSTTDSIVTCIVHGKPRTSKNMCYNSEKGDWQCFPETACKNLVKFRRPTNLLTSHFDPSTPPRPPLYINVYLYFHPSVSR